MTETLAGVHGIESVRVTAGHLPASTMLIFELYCTYMRFDMSTVEVTLDTNQFDGAHYPIEWDNTFRPQL